MEISQDFKEFFELLNRNKVRYLVVGGYAFAIHAEPRYTKDPDIFFDRNKDNAKRLLQTLEAFGFGSLELSTDDLTKPGRIIQIGYPPLRIDLLNQIEGVSFSEAWKRKITATYDKEIIHVVSKQDLIRNKKASGRDQDLLDVKRLEISDE